jgi:hypothetical protein
VDTLIDLLATNGQVPVRNAFNHHLHSQTKAGPPSPAKTPDISQSSTASDSARGTPDTSSLNSDSCTHFDPVDAGIVSEQDADARLKEFQNAFTQSFPFVVIPPSTSMNDLRKNYPFLFLAIMTVTACKHPATQRDLVIRLRDEIATRIIKNSHRSLELLQGLLIYAAW